MHKALTNMKAGDQGCKEDRARLSGCSFLQ